MDRARIPSSVVPVAVISDFPKDTAVSSSAASDMSWTIEHEESARVVRCVDLGAVDVLTSPFDKDRVKSLAMHCYKAEKRSIGKGWSWVGEEQATSPGPADFVYLREKMVSELMHDIIKPKRAITTAASQLRIAPGRMDVLRQAVGKWHFSAHDFSNDELLQCAVIILEHALKMPEVERYRMSTERLVDFLIASKAAYNDAIPYHNFRHVVDVLQACFAILLEMGVLPPYPYNGQRYPERRTTLAALVRPVDALTLLISAVGHDAGHPGVNNAFLVNLKAPLAQLYNDRSVLESFHCAAFSQVIRKYWPKVQTAEFRKTMIDIILATDMGLHFDYMGHLEALKRKLAEDSGIAGWDEKTMQKHRILLLSLIIKCADISNVARGHECAAQWAIILIDEFSRQASMENQLGIPSALAVAPKPGSMLALAKSQCGFMKLFAIPLFESLAEIVPELSISVTQLQANIEKWLWKVKDCEVEDQPADLRMLGASRAPPNAEANIVFSRSADVDGENKQTPSSLTTSRRSSGQWSEDLRSRTREETPRSSTGSPLPPQSRSTDAVDRGGRQFAQRQHTEPIIVVDDAYATTTSNGTSNYGTSTTASRVTKTLSSFRSRADAKSFFSTSQTPSYDPPSNTTSNSGNEKSYLPYAPTPVIPDPNSLSRPSNPNSNRPKSSPAGHNHLSHQQNSSTMDITMGADDEKSAAAAGGRSMRRKPSHFFKVKIWSKIVGTEKS